MDVELLQRAFSEPSAEREPPRFGPASLLSRVKSMAAQHGQGEAIQKPVKMMRDFFSSLSTAPLAGPLHEGVGVVYTNRDSTPTSAGEDRAGHAPSPSSVVEGSPCLPSSPNQFSPPLSPPPPSPSPSPPDPQTQQFIASVNKTR